MHGHSIHKKPEFKYDVLQVVGLGRMRIKERAEMVRQDLRLINRDQGPAIVNPNQLRILEMLGQSFGVGGRHQLVLACPDDEDRTAEQTLLLGPLEQEPLLGYVSKVFGQVTTNLSAVDGSG